MGALCTPYVPDVEGEKPLRTETSWSLDPRFSDSEYVDWKAGKRPAKPKPKYWRVRYRDPRIDLPQLGPWINGPHFPTKRAAEAWASKMKTAIASGQWKHPDQVKAEEEAARIAEEEADRERARAQAEAKYPFKAYAESWLKTRRLAASTRDGYETYLNAHILPKWGETPIREITTAQVRTWIATELAPGKPGARKHAFELFKTIMATAVDDDVITSSPCKRNMLGSTKADAGQSQRHAPRALTAEEVQALAAEVPAYMRAAVLVDATTGLRMGELRELRVKDFDRQEGTLSVSRSVSGTGKTLHLSTPKTKAGTRVVQLDPATVQLVVQHLAARHITDPDALMFPSSGDVNAYMPPKTFQLNIKHALERLGFDHASPHDFRHTAASVAGRTPGVSPKDVQGLLGQSTPGMALRYMKTDDEHQRRIASALAEEILAPPTAKDREGAKEGAKVTDLEERRRERAESVEADALRAAELLEELRRMGISDPDTVARLLNS